MSDDVTVDATSLNRWISRFTDEVGANLELVLRQQMRLCLKDCIDWTPPKSYAAGRKKVSDDFSRASSPAATYLAPIVRSRMTKGRYSGLQLTRGSGSQMETEQVFEFQMERFQELIKQRNYAGFNALLGNMKGKLSKWKAVPFSTTLFTDAPRTGAGGIQARHLFVFDIKQWKSQLARIQSHVGRLKAGWLAAYRAVGGNNVAGWITKQEAGARGTFAVLIATHWVHGSKLVITAENHALGVGRTRSIVNRAVKKRENSMRKDIHLYLKGIKDVSQIS